MGYFERTCFKPGGYGEWAGRDYITPANEWKYKRKTGINSVYRPNKDFDMGPYYTKLALSMPWKSFKAVQEYINSIPTNSFIVNLKKKGRKGPTKGYRHETDKRIKLLYKVGLEYLQELKAEGREEDAFELTVLSKKVNIPYGSLHKYIGSRKEFIKQLKILEVDRG